MNSNLVPGSIQNSMQSNNQSLAQAFMNVSHMILCDCSGSMDTVDFKDGRSRWERMKEALAKVQAQHPGQIMVISFSDQAEVNLDGVPSPVTGSTNLDAALIYALSHQINELQIQLIVISDGMPDDSEGCLKTAAQISAPIDTIFIGPEDPQDIGRAFLQKLARKTGGTHADAAGARFLKEKMDILLLGQSHEK
jgi:Mg-chelatase subunit ChlD